VDEDFLLIPADRVARIAGISRQRLYYWERSGLVRPTYRRVVHPHLTIRLYNLADLTVVAVAAELVRQSGVSLQNVRRTRGAFLSRVKEPLREFKWAVVQGRKGKPELWVQYPDGTWEGGSRPGHPILDEGMLSVEPIKTRVAAEARRPERRSDDAIGRVEKRFGVRRKAPVFGETRIPVALVWEYLDEGASDDEILEAYPSLTHRDLAKARLLREAARRVKAGSIEVGALSSEYPDLSDDEIRSVRQLTRVA
jgi:uncharacterized protein (DUF433 family)